MRIVTAWLWGLFLMGVGYGQNGWEITAEKMQPYAPICLANGALGLNSSPEPLATQSLILNGIYDRTSPQGVSRILQGINPMHLRLWVNGKPVSSAEILSQKQSLHLREAVLRTEFSTQNLKGTSELLSLGHLPEGMILRLRLEATQQVSIALSDSLTMPSQYAPESISDQIKQLDDQQMHLKIRSVTAKTKYQGHSVAAALTLATQPEGEITQRGKNLWVEYHLKKGESVELCLLSAVCHSKNYAFPTPQAERLVVFMKQQGVEKLLEQHRAYWANLWQNDIEITGDPKAQQAVRLALFNLYGSVREGSQQSIPPFGLTAQNYNGHIFWDAETWILPPLMMLNPEMAKSALEYRIQFAQQARHRAQSFGYQGMMFPWESDDTGEECTPAQYLTGILEQHISADIGTALWQYFCASKDKQWLENKALPLMQGIAEFWESRITPNPDGSFSIKNVVGADEYFHGADDNAFTNGAVKKFFANLLKTYAVLGKNAPKKWILFRDNLLIHQDAHQNITLENAQYKGETIKQADVNLLAYPLGIITDKTRILNDIRYYEPKIDPNGPAMSHSVFAVIYARLGQGQKAYDYFLQSFQPNQREPFGVLAETRHNNDTYFLTAAGGMLQVVLNGFLGLDFSENGIVQGKTCLPPQWQKIVLKRNGKIVFSAEK